LIGTEAFFQVGAAPWPRYAAAIFRAPPDEAAARTAVAPFSLHHFCQLSSLIR
jgi:hypothetical protein